MTNKKEIANHTEELLLPIAESNGVKIYDVEFVKEGPDWYLRAYIDKEGGVNIQDCENVSRAMSEVLDREDYIDMAYTFEVSSPGLGRTLKKDRHLQNSLGETVEVNFYEAQDGVKETEGELTAFDKESITLKNGEGQEEKWPRSAISAIRCKLEL